MTAWIKILIVATGLASGTAWAYVAGKSGRGLPAALAKPVRVDVRESSVGSGRRGRSFIYFGTSRRFRGGGPSFGK